MRLAILSDVHGNLAALQAVIEDLHRRSADRVVNLGDHASGPLFPLETARLLMGQDWLHLAGNHERQLLTLEQSDMNASDAYTRPRLGQAELEWMAGQSSTVALDDPPILLCHGTPHSDRLYFLETVTSTGVLPATAEDLRDRLGNTDAELVACGHTHIPRVVTAPGGTLIVNPGSVGLPAYDDDQPRYHRMQTGSPNARYAVVERRRHGWSCELISLPYAFEPMAEQAESVGRDDWARALRTGYV